MKNKKLGFNKVILLASLIFGIFFGAGNLIFPIHLGQAAGANWLPATIGFVLTGTIVPYLAMLAVSVTKSEDLYALAQPVSHYFALFIVVAFHLVIGPLFATPRLPAVAFSTGIAPLLPAKYNTVGLLIFTIIFFGLAYLLTVKKADITAWIGKYLNPLFLLGLLVLFVVAFLFPMGNLNYTPTTAYQNNAFTAGFMEGYNTMDGVGLLTVGVTIVYAVRGLGVHDDNISKEIAKAGALSVVAEALIYIVLILMGTMSLGQLKLSENGGIALAQIISHYAGNAGLILTAILVTLTVFTTAMGLFQAFAQDMEAIFPKYSYRFWLRVITIGSLIVANLGLTTIIAWSVPVMMMLYPYALGIIGLSLCKKYFDGSPLVYRWTIGLITIPAIGDMFANLPISNDTLQYIVAGYHHLVPFSSQGLGWILPGLLGALIGYGQYRLIQTKMIQKMDK